MHRIDTPTAQTDKFGAGKNGFTRGNPQTGVPATALDDDYFDAIQEEIARVIESTGAVLNKNNRAQLLAAINTLIANGGTDFLKKTNNLSEIKDAGPTAVAQTLTNLGLTGIGIGLPTQPTIANFDFQTFVFTSGANYAVSSSTWLNVPVEVVYPTGIIISITVISVPGSNVILKLVPHVSSAGKYNTYYVRMSGAAGSRTIYVTQDWNSANKIPASGIDVATNAEVAAGIADKLVNVPGLMSLFSKRSFTTADHIRIPDVPGGLIIQWIRGSTAGFNEGAFPAITFPIPFPTACVFVTAGTQGNNANTSDYMAQVTSWTQTSATIFCQQFTTTAASGSIYPLVLAIGY